MNIFPHLAMLTFAATFISPIHQHQINFKMTSPDRIERINQLWLVTYINEAGQETVAQAKLATGEYAPLMAADAARLESMMPAARGLAKASNLKMRLIKLANSLRHRGHSAVSISGRLLSEKDETRRRLFYFSSRKVQ